ncbi:hypothetical protein EYF80_054647 [Liparis tanakae]|uniref:Uncharacterized protein n=1 Tax=Liparis tanakae TaxID=230148 RepID=A0A4Z2F223_9TELE|nr:hypothetical protein EYF80_054647 [Liparis tanakae]
MQSVPLPARGSDHVFFEGVFIPLRIPQCVIHSSGVKYCSSCYSAGEKRLTDVSELKLHTRGPESVGYEKETPAEIARRADACDSRSPQQWATGGERSSKAAALHKTPLNIVVCRPQ